jgi:hypothetical protein
MPRRIIDLSIAIERPRDRLLSPGKIAQSRSAAAAWFYGQLLPG